VSRIWWLVLLLALVATAGATAAEEEAPRIVVLPFDFIETSGAKPDEAERHRLGESAEQIRRALAASERYVLVDAAPAAELVETLGRRQILYRCNGCDIEIGRALDADLVVTGWVQKVSNLILNMNFQVRDVESGKLVGGASADMRGNTDESWRRAARFLIERRLLAQ
jgi:hypothetical protein